MSNFTALFDACVLYPAPLRDLLLRLAGTDLFRARWTDRIHDEWIENLLKNRTDLTSARLMRTRMLMNDSVPDCLVTGYEGLIETLDLPDPRDRHVVAAAIRCQAGVIVTFNLKDFPQPVLEQYGLQVQHPDQFLVHLIDLNRGTVAAAAKLQRAALKNPALSPREFLDTLLRQGLAGTVCELETMVELL